MAWLTGLAWSIVDAVSSRERDTTVTRKSMWMARRETQVNVGCGGDKNGCDGYDGCEEDGIMCGLLIWEKDWEMQSTISFEANGGCDFPCFVWSSLGACSGANLFSVFIALPHSMEDGRAGSQGRDRNENARKEIGYNKVNNNNARRVLPSLSVSLVLIRSQSSAILLFISGRNGNAPFLLAAGVRPRNRSILFMHDDAVKMKPRY